MREFIEHNRVDRNWAMRSAAFLVAHPAVYPVVVVVVLVVVYITPPSTNAHPITTSHTLAR